MNNLKRKTLEYAIVASVIFSGIFFFNKAIEKVEDKIRSIRKQRVIYETVCGDINKKQRVIYETVCGDINNIVRYPHLFSEDRLQEILEPAFNSPDPYDAFYIENLQKGIIKFYESIQNYCGGWKAEKEEIEKNSAEIRNYIIEHVEQNNKEYEIFPDRGNFLDRG